ncbi:MAG TPA: DUF3369 domain-containing protein [Rhodoblastus sp.]|nr:DUF3369 domain-containing protein [Rhodoblastus sp.]
MSDDDIIRLIDDEPPAPARADARAWKVAVIDDDPAVHDGTRFALYDYSLNGDGIELVFAHSAAEGRKLLLANPDIAVILLDVVMESDRAGLELVNYIRRELRNEAVRIILRTGEPGQAPERQVIVDYDINDYKAKTELTADKLFTSLTAALRSHMQLRAMIETRRGLEIIIEATPTLFDFRSMQRLAEGVLTQVASLLAVDCAGILILRDLGAGGRRLAVLAGSGVYRGCVGAESLQGLDRDLLDLVDQAFSTRRAEFRDRRTVLYISTHSGAEIVVFLEAGKRLTETDRALIEVFSGRLSIAFDNVVLYSQLENANVDLERRVEERTAELLAANRRLEAQWRRVRQVNDFQSEVLGKVAHDLKNPLNVILGRSEILEELFSNTSEGGQAAQPQLRHIRSSALRLTSMIDELIADAMNDALDISVRNEIVDLAAIVRDVAEANRPLAERKSQTVELALSGVLATECDPERIREAIDNLVSNAVKYSRIGGAIRVEAYPADEGNVVQVVDSGPGFMPEDMSRLFGRFQRLSAKPTGGETSTGLGLSIVKKIVDLHDGSIAVTQGETGGASISIRLKAAHYGTRA